MSCNKTRLRLREANGRLELLDAERMLFRDNRIGWAEEEAIICRELIELELQAIDEEIEETCNQASQQTSGIQHGLRR